MNKTALITGATSGIGEATAILMAENNYNLIITGRRTAKLKSLEKKLGKKIKVLCLSFDITKKAEVEKAISSLPKEWTAIDVLVNNAGLASGLDSIQNGDFEDWEKMIDTNVKGLLYITRLVAPMMVKRKKGHIVNISSVAGKEVYPLGNVYCASKHAVDALSKAMRVDMLEHGIKVTNIAPGMVETEFSLVRFHGDSKRAKSVYDGITPLNAVDVAEAIIFAVTRPPHVNVNDLLLMPTAQASATQTHKKK
ncbi:MAG: NAD(P)-dependent oxidoreductase [Bacteroidetes bacterium HGW-Bacteroidetes-21]|jgi:hypothetical protein|nr:MAG: NAD(P)-dependent oxidoreductase [Bacteroidetes bacterium HGW-Bacteroidetes-21]